MVYSPCVYSTIFLNQAFCTTLLLNWKYTPYYHYITGLNYWETNLFYIWCIVLLFCFVSSKPLIFATSGYYLKLSVFRDWLTPQVLIPNLIVGTVVIHPLAFYLFTTLTFLFLFFKGKAFSNSLVPLKLKTLSIFLLLTLLLGSVWAVQSNSWGYFWVNDTIEWLLLTLILYLLYYIHYWTLRKNDFNESLIIYFLINLIILIRLNFLPTRHNFITTKITIYLVVFSYYFLFEFFRKQICLQKKNNIWVSTVLFLILLTVCIQSQNSYAVLILKFLWVIMLLYTLALRVSNFINNLYSHALLLPFTLVWLSLFNFFDIVYTHTTQLQVITWVSFESLVTTTTLTFFNTNKYNLLEFVEFSNSNKFSSFSFSLNNIAAYVILGNFCLIYLLYFIFFIFKTGWI